MADTVRYLAEAMVPELEDLERKGYFSRAELRAVAQKRTEFEYLLKRKAALKSDYLRYVQYESRLEELRRSRKVLRGIPGGRQGLAEHGIVRRIHFVFERALRKFRGDLGLWGAWLDFCRRSRSYRQLSKVVTKALHLNPTAAGLWAYAAAWQFEHGADPGTARVLMQRGLRMCAGSGEGERGLWHEYFRMELLYAARLRARRGVLGLGDAGMGMGDDDDTGADGGDANGDGDAGGDASQKALAKLLRGGVAAIVYDRATKAVPDDVEFRGGFFRILRQYRFPGMEGLEARVLESVAADFPGSAEAWDLRARAAAEIAAEDAEEEEAAAAAAAQGEQGEGAEGEAKGAADAVADAAKQQRSEAAAVGAAAAVYARALAALPTPAMHDAALRFLCDALRRSLSAADAAVVAAKEDGEEDEAEEEEGKAGAAARGRKRGRQQQQQAAAASKSKKKQCKGQGEDSSPASRARGLAADIVALCEGAHAKGVASDYAYATWRDLLLRGSGSGSAGGATAAASRVVEAWRAAHPASVAAWQAAAAALEQRLASVLTSGAAAANNSNGGSSSDEDEADDGDEGGGDASARQQLRALLRGIPQGDAGAPCWLAATELATTMAAAASASSTTSSSTGSGKLQRRCPAALGDVADALVAALSGAARGAPAAAMGDAAAALLHAVRALAGLGVARALLRRLAALPPPSCAFLLAMVDLEEGAAEFGEDGSGASGSKGSGKGGGVVGSAALRGDAAAQRRVRALLDAAAEAYGGVDMRVWLRYARFEAACGRGAGPVHWRATRVLRDPAPFLQRYAEEHGGVGGAAVAI